MEVHVRFRLGLCLKPRSAPDPLARFKRPTSKGRGGQGREGLGRGKVGGGEERGGTVTLTFQLLPYTKSISQLILLSYALRHRAHSRLYALELHLV